MLPQYVAPDKRSATGKRWAQAKAEKRLEHGVDADTLRSRALCDARGTIVREGCTYRATGITNWQVRRAVAGRCDQYEFIANGRVKLLGGPRLLPAWARPENL